MMSVMLTLGIVLGLMGIALRVLRKYAAGGATTNGTIKMEVIQRLTLGQRQGIAVVRIGSRVLAVSMGDGGVHPVAELNADEIAAIVPAAETTIVPARAVASLRTMVDAVRGREKVAPENTDAGRISYVAPMEDFQAVLNIAMSGAVRS